MMMQVNMLGGSDVVDVVAQNDKGYLLVRRNDVLGWSIYGFEWQGKRNVPHVGSEKYIRRLWDKRYCQGQLVKWFG